MGMSQPFIALAKHVVLTCEESHTTFPNLVSSECLIDYNL